MSYVVLARKWRPQSFDDLVGQEHVAKTLENAIALGRVAHAFLFTGVRGVGKTTSARILAKALNCAKGPTAKPCLECSACVEIAAGNDVDVQEIDGASYNGVDEVRRLQETLPYRPTRDRFKIFIVDEVHMLTTAAWNAFLKTLEEPPPHVKFIFATTEVHKVPITILSRCQRYDFKLIDAGRIAARLRHVLGQEKIAADDGALRILAREAAGSMRDAMSLLDQVIAWAEAPEGGSSGLAAESVAKVLGVAQRTVFHRMGAALLKGDAGAALGIVDEVAQEGYDLVHVTRDLLAHLRDLVVVKVAPDHPELRVLPAEELEEMRRLVASAQPDDLLRLHQGLSKQFDDIGKSGQPRAALEMTLVRLARRPPLLAIEEMIERLADLERRLGGGGGGSRSPGGSGGAAPRRPQGGAPAPGSGGGYGAAPAESDADGAASSAAQSVAQASAPPTEAATPVDVPPPAPSPEARSPEARSPEARSPEPTSPEARSPEARSPEPTSPPSIGASATAAPATVPATPVHVPTAGPRPKPPPATSPPPNARPVSFRAPLTFEAPQPQPQQPQAEGASTAPPTIRTPGAPTTPHTPQARPPASSPPPSGGAPGRMQGGNWQPPAPPSFTPPDAMPASVRAPTSSRMAPPASGPTTSRALSIPSNMVLPTNDDPTFLKWRGVVSRIRDERPALASILEHASIDLSDERLTIGFEEGSFLLERATEANARTEIERLAKDLVQPGCEIALVSRGASAVRGWTLAHVAARDRRARVDAVRRSIEQHPLVGAAIELLGARLSDVRLPQELQDSL